MIKSIIKEIFITILLLIAIFLVLSVVFYNYRPSTKKIPTEVAEYKMPEEMVTELGNTVDDIKEQNIVTTYTIDSKDLKADKIKDKYETGKVNPFSNIQTPSNNEGNTNSNNTGNTNNGTNSNSVNNPNTNSSTEEPQHFFNTVK